MSTRSTIWIKRSELVFEGIYCHFDGYPEFNGKILAEHYNTQEKIEDLIALGNLSSLAKSTECPDGHTFEKPVDGYCVAYGRDRHEKNQSAVTTYCEANTKQQQYNYLWQDGEWFVTTSGGIYSRLSDILGE
jgi:hypothetical protein